LPLHFKFLVYKFSTEQRRCHLAILLRIRHK
jgi:hypothetical protein